MSTEPYQASRLVLSRPAKTLLIVFIALGLISVAGEGCSDTPTATTGDVVQWNYAAKTLNTGMTTWSKAVNTCVRNDDLTCAMRVNEAAAGYLDAFIAQAGPLTLPPAAAAGETSLLAIADKSQSDFETISVAWTMDQYQGDIASTNLVQDLTSLRTDLVDVATTLHKPQSS